MCGIAGWLGKIEEKTALKMISSLDHRGPDNQSYKIFNNACLAHTRLSIIDLSSNGDQPISDKDGIIWVVFNGEIYNHKQLKQEFISQENDFKGKSDSEILPYLYLKYGDTFVSKLNGMFSIAVYDTRNNKLLVTRDRFGIKPLFYSIIKKGLVFSSEINALKVVPGINLDINEQSIYDFAALSYIPAPSTFYKNIFSLEPGTSLVATFKDTISYDIFKYKTWSIDPDKNSVFANVSNNVENLLTKSVSDQLETDAPFGSLLSGGIDSSLVSSIAQKKSKEQINTYSVKFSDSIYDETWAAKSVANKIGSNHKVLDVQENTGSWDFIIDNLMNCGQPFADTSMFAMNSISKLMVKEGRKMVLAGDGGDEGFGGYKYYLALPKIINYKKLPQVLWNSIDQVLSFLYRKKIINSTFAGSFHDFANSNNTALIRNLFSHIRENEQRELFRNNNYLSTDRLFEKQWDYPNEGLLNQSESIIAQTTEVNIRLQLPNDFLFKVDISSMKEGLEVRVPMLDNDLIDYALKIPRKHKAYKGQTKLALRDIAKKLLPKDVANKVKMGFSIPVDDWIDDDCRNRIYKTLNREDSPLSLILEKKIYSHWLEAFNNKKQVRGISRGGLYYRIIMLLSLDLHL